MNVEVIEALRIMNNGGRRVTVVWFGKSYRMVGRTNASIGHIGQSDTHVGGKLTRLFPAKDIGRIHQRREVELCLVSDTRSE